MKIELLKKLLKPIKKELEKSLMMQRNIELQIKKLELAAKNLLLELENEKKVVLNFPEVNHTFSEFYKQFQTRRNALKEETEEMKKKHYKIQKTVHNLFIEKKRYENLIEQEMIKKRKKEQKLESELLDESGLKSFSQKKV